LRGKLDIVNVLEQVARRPHKVHSAGDPG
jgi:hypothetical protein